MQAKEVIEVTSNGDVQVVEVGYSQPGGGSGGGDKFYSQSFLNQTSVTVHHNLNKYPSVSIADSFGDVVLGDFVYNNSNTVTLSFSAPTSGTVYCN